MSPISRWSNVCSFYTYWSTEDVTIKEKEVIIIMFDTSTEFKFTYEEINENIDVCVKFVIDRIKDKMIFIESIEVRNLKDIMNKFSDCIDKFYE